MKNNNCLKELEWNIKILRDDCNILLDLARNSELVLPIDIRKMIYTRIEPIQNKLSEHGLNILYDKITEDEKILSVKFDLHMFTEDLDNLKHLIEGYKFKDYQNTISSLSIEMKLSELKNLFNKIAIIDRDYDKFNKEIDKIFKITEDGIRTLKTVDNSVGLLELLEFYLSQASLLLDLYKTIVEI